LAEADRRLEVTDGRGGSELPGAVDVRHARELAGAPRDPGTARPAPTRSPPAVDPATPDADDATANAAPAANSPHRDASASYGDAATSDRDPSGTADRDASGNSDASNAARTELGLGARHRFVSYAVIGARQGLIGARQGLVGAVRLGRASLVLTGRRGRFASARGRGDDQRKGGE
jgi:hypothetical protein